MADTKHSVVIVGGGTAGITVAASLRRRAPRNLDIAIVEPASSHYYQPAWTLVGGGVYPLEKTRRAEASLVPSGVTLIVDAAKEFRPDDNAVVLESGDVVTYDYLVACPGLVLDWDKIDGLPAALGTNGICSNYSADYAEYTWSCIQSLKSGGKALFTQPPMPFKCPGAPQKIAYLTADYLRRKGLLKSSDVQFFTATPGIFGVPYFARALTRVAKRYGMGVNVSHNLVAVDAGSRKATFEIVSEDRKGERVTLDFDMLHVTPPQSAPDVVKTSPLANEAGWIDVDQNTLRHTKYANVFALGDAASSPNSKTAAAVRKQAPVVVRNILRSMDGRALDPGYDGYASCPLTTARGKVIMAEFVYGGKVTPTLPLNPGKERWINWWIKVTGLPLMYWHYMLKGREWFPGHNTKWSGDDS
ncbi:MAG: FAD/NAD(P)-binding oxidoreductase [Bauldia litoralis]